MPVEPAMRSIPPGLRHPSVYAIFVLCAFCAAAAESLILLSETGAGPARRSWTWFNYTGSGAVKGKKGAYRFLP